MSQGFGGPGWQQQQPPGWGQPHGQQPGQQPGNWGTPGNPVIMQPQPRKRGGMCLIIGIIVALVVAAMIGGFVYFIINLTAPPREATHEFLRKLRADDYDGAWNKTSADFRRRVPKEAFSSTVTGILPNARSSKDATFNSTEISNNRACLSGSLTGGSGDSHIAVRLVNENGDWLVDEFSSGRVGGCDN